jgi:pyrroline-5-carboxylate reductase
MNIGFIGFGNMAQALADGLLYKNAVKPEQIHACAKNWDKLVGSTVPKGFIPCRDTAELVDKSDMVVIAVKPYLVEEVVKPVRDKLAGKIVISVAVNYTFDKYEEILLPGTHHMSTLPNTPVKVGEGVIVCESKNSLTEEEYDTFVNLFSKIALIEKVDTKNIGIAGTISGCGPAFASMFKEALSDAAVMHGLPRELSYKLASQMVVGTGKLQLMTGAHPGAMKDAVCSPGGTTIVGVAALERKGLRSAVIDAVDEIQNKKK